jgi:hypothetical protein
MGYINYKADLPVEAKIESLAANTNKAITIPAGCNAVFVYNPGSKPIWYRLDSAAVVPSAAVQAGEGMLPPGSNYVKLSLEAFATGHTLNVISADAVEMSRAFYVEQ